jgi:hypothetical protein
VLVLQKDFKALALRFGQKTGNVKAGAILEEFGEHPRSIRGRPCQSTTVFPSGKGGYGRGNIIALSPIGQGEVITS